MVFKKILVALDRSVQEPIVLEKALEHARLEGARLLLVHCIRRESDMQTGPFLGIGTLADLDTYGTLRRLQQEQLKKDMEHAQTWLQTQCDSAKQDGIDAEWMCVVGEPSVELCNLAGTWEADLIVIGRRGHQGLSEIVLGSVSNYVVHHAPCSVLIVQGIAAKSGEATEEAIAHSPGPAIPSAPYDQAGTSKPLGVSPATPLL